MSVEIETVHFSAEKGEFFATHLPCAKLVDAHLPVLEPLLERLPLHIDCIDLSGKLRDALVATKLGLTFRTIEVLAPIRLARQEKLRQQGVVFFHRYLGLADTFGELPRLRFSSQHRTVLSSGTAKGGDFLEEQRRGGSSL